MATNHLDSKRIVKNTGILYIRMLFMIVISLYTSRVVLKTLGFDDFGLYNVVGGIVVILSFLNTSMSGATQRFLNVELGREDHDRLRKVFSTSLFIHVCLAGIIILLAETVGLWFLNNYMNIAPERMEAANWVFHFSVLSFTLTILSVPYNGAIISHERMGAFAYITIGEATMKLLVVFLLQVISYDKLIVYALLMVAVSAIVLIIDTVYAGIKFKECRGLSLKYEPTILRQMIGFSGWTAFGALGSLSHTQGIAIVMNWFFGLTVNAALGIANQVTHIVNNFVTNFMTALNPQIVKTYAAHQLYDTQTLLKRGSKLGICLVTFFAVPLIIETPAILNLWLEDVPEYAATFIRIILLTSICNAYASPLAAAKGATGNIRNYQIILTSLGWMHLPLAWIFFELGYPPYYAMYVYFVLINIMQGVRIYMVCKSIDLSIKDFCSEVLLRCGFMILAAFSLPYLSHRLLPFSLVSSLATIAIALVSVSISIYFIALQGEERKTIRKFLVAKISGR